MEGNAEWIEEMDGQRGREEMMMGKEAGQRISFLSLDRLVVLLVY